MVFCLSWKVTLRPFFGGKTWHFVSMGCQREGEMKEEVIFGEKVVDESAIVFSCTFRVGLLQPSLSVHTHTIIKKPSLLKRTKEKENQPNAG